MIVGNFLYVPINAWKNEYDLDARSPYGSKGKYQKSILRSIQLVLLFREWIVPTEMNHIGQQDHNDIIKKLE